MNRLSVAPALLAIMALVAPLSAQSNAACAGQALDRVRNVCDAAIDGARVFHPVVGLLVSGGNTVIGRADAIGAFPRLSLAFRVNAVRVVTPDLDYNGVGRTVGAGDEVVAPAPSLEAAVGVFPGVSGGHLAVDLLGAAHLLPTDQIDDVRIDSEASRVGGVALAFGYGARVTVVGGAGAAPAIVISAMRRSLPRIDVGDVPAGDRFAFGTDLRATNLRVTVGKQLGILAIAAGYGHDSFTGDAEIAYRDPLTGTVQPSIRIELDDTRSLGFVNVGIGRGIVRVAAEVGMQQGRNLGLGTTFEDNDPAEGRLFGGAGIRIGF